MKKSKSQALKITAMLAMLVAISIIAGKFLAIRGGDILRFSFENLPIIFAGIAFGPIPAVLVGVVADLIGCLMVGYAINPIVTLGAAFIGATSGIVYILLKRTPIADSAVIVITVILSHLVGSVLIKTFGLAVFYDMPVWLLMLWRLLNYLIVGAIEAVLLLALMKNKEISSRLSRIGKNGEHKNDVR